MKNKKRLQFYQLAFVFTAITIAALLYNWGYASKENKSESMMTESMGGMMSTMHLKNIKLSDLFISKEMNTKADNLNSQKYEERSYIKEVFNLSTIIVVILTPFIIAGTAFLAIIWTK